MKVLHINTVQDGGAAWCARRISKALVQNGVESRMLYALGNELPQNELGAIAQKDDCPWLNMPIVGGVIWRLIRIAPFLSNANKLQEQLDAVNKDHLYLHIPLSNYTNIANHPLIDWADIIHLHWVTGFVDYPTFFKKVNKPIVWTLHDKYPAVGLQHYSSEFFPIPNELKTLDDYCKRIKRESLLKAKNLNIVAISEMMLDICRNSEVLTGFPVTLIHNGIDPNSFEIHDRIQSRKELGLVLDATIFLFSGYNIHDSNKGLNRVIEAMEGCDIPNKMLVCIGLSNMPVPDASFPIILAGLLVSEAKISKYYSAADFFLQASYEETFSQTPLEAMSCGTPVISFPVSGAQDLINEENGVICDDFTIDALANGIKLAMTRGYSSDKIREDVINRFSYAKIAKQYIELYKSVLNKK